MYERSQHPAQHSITFGSIVVDPRPHRGERVGRALGVPAPIHQRTSQKRVSRSEPLGRRVVSRGKPAVAQPRHPEASPASEPQLPIHKGTPPGLDRATASAHKARPWLAPMAFLDPVDPTTEGLLWPRLRRLLLRRRHGSDRGAAAVGVRQADAEALDRRRREVRRDWSFEEEASPHNASRVDPAQRQPPSNPLW